MEKTLEELRAEAHQRIAEADEPELLRMLSILVLGAAKNRNDARIAGLELQQFQSKLTQFLQSRNEEPFDEGLFWDWMTQQPGLHAQSATTP